MTQADLSEIDALILLHQNTERQGPGDAALSAQILAQLPPLPPAGTLADLGCGSGVASLTLAQHFQRPVTAVDLSPDFLAQLQQRAAQAGLADQIQPLCADMGALDPEQHRFALIWSEGAAYALGFETALARWRPLLVPGGLAVISEMSWFSDSPAGPAQSFWQAAYPQMGTEAQNISRARSAGFELLATRRLPAEAWWDSYYNPLLAQMAQYADHPAPVMQQVLQDTQHEIDLFRQFSNDYGYCFYLLRAP